MSSFSVSPSKIFPFSLFKKFDYNGHLSHFFSYVFLFRVNNFLSSVGLQLSLDPENFQDYFVKHFLQCSFLSSPLQEIRLRSAETLETAPQPTDAGSIQGSHSGTHGAHCLRPLYTNCV